MLMRKALANARDNQDEHVRKRRKVLRLLDTVALDREQKLSHEGRMLAVELLIFDRISDTSGALLYLDYRLIDALRFPH
jgi:hypothetical protein